MPVSPIPVQRYLVPDGLPSPAPGFTIVDQKILRSLPFTINLEQNLDLVLAMPTGIAAIWRDADPAAIVSQSSRETGPWQPQSAPVGDAGRPPLRFLVRYKNAAVAILPLVTGYQALAPSNDSDHGIRILLSVIQWDLRAGNVRGPGDFGSRITLAWKHADQGINEFGPLPVHRYVWPRLYLEIQRLQEVHPEKKFFWVESELGLKKFETKVFKTRKAVAK